MFCVRTENTSPVLCTLLIFSCCYCFLQVFATSQISHAVSVSIYGLTCRVGFRQVPILLHTLGTSRIPAALLLSNLQQPATKPMLCRFDSRTILFCLGEKIVVATQLVLVATYYQIKWVFHAREIKELQNMFARKPETRKPPGNFNTGGGQC